MTRRRAFEFARAPADETPLDWRTIAVVQMFSMLSIAGTTALFSTAYFAARALRPEASEASRALVAGALTATKPLASGASSLAWGRLGDARGFERAICASGVAHAIATAAFAMARTTSGAFAARACQGLADGMVVMQKPALALVSDETNVARAFATTGGGVRGGERAGAGVGGGVERAVRKLEGVRGRARRAVPDVFEATSVLFEQHMDRGARGADVDGVREGVDADR